MPECNHECEKVDDKECGAMSPTGHCYCTRDAGHTGKHSACAAGHDVEVWDRAEGHNDIKVFIVKS